MARRYRSDLFKDVSTGEDDALAKSPWLAVHCVYISGHAQLSKRDALVAQVFEMLPQAFAKLPETTTRKPTKEETEGMHFFFNAKAADLQKAKDEGKVLTWRQQGADIYCRTLDSAAALFAKTGKLALLPLDDTEAVAMAGAGVRQEIAIVHVRHLQLPTGCSMKAGQVSSTEKLHCADVVR